MRVVAVVLACATGCSGDNTGPTGETGNETDTDTDTDSDTDADTDADADADADTDADTEPPPAWGDVLNTFQIRCGGCHYAPVGPPKGEFEFADSTDLVGVASNQLPSMPYITAGDPDNSYVWHKLNGTQLTVGGEGTNMPSTAGQLSAGELQLIQAWIVGGALP